MQVNALIDRLYKKHFGPMVIALAKYTGLKDLATAEDIVQDAFLEASRKWPAGAPEKPEAWLYRVCRNMAFKHFRDSPLTRAQGVYESETTILHQVDKLFEDDEEDDQLMMLYSCVHPLFAPKSQVIFALRYVAGFRVEQIALVLGMQIEAVTKSLFRMRETIVHEQITFQAGSLSLSVHKTRVVLQVLYLMFSEGYRSSKGKSLLNHELCEDALSLTQAIARSPALGCPEAEGLLALILFGLSRFEARFNEANELVDLEHQDRNRWNKEMIRLAAHHLTRATEARYGTWHLEAAIAYLHSSAPAFADTNWKGIVNIYNIVLSQNDSPFTRLNQAVAMFYGGETNEALEKMIQLGRSAIMQRYHLYHVAMGKFYGRLGDAEKSEIHFGKAIGLTSHAAEKDFIRKLMVTKDL